MSIGWISLLLELSGRLAFGSMGVWALLRLVAYFAMILGPRPPKFFPVSAQRLGFAQALGSRSVILSEADYHARCVGRGFLQKLATSWWPLVAWVALIQFVVVFGARGLANELSIPFWLGLAMSASAMFALASFRRRMVFDHLRQTDLEEGRELDWDAEAFLGVIRLRVRFEGRARKVPLERLERNAIAKDRAEQFHFHGISAQPDSAHRHGQGLIASEFHMFGSAEEKMTEENWTRKIKMSDALQSILTAYVMANDQKASAVALLEYPGAVILLTPLSEHVEFLEAVGDRLRRRKKTPAMAARDIALAAAQEFPSRFDEARVAELMAHQEWVSQGRMDV